VVVRVRAVSLTLDRVAVARRCVAVAVAVLEEEEEVVVLRARALDELAWHTAAVAPALLVRRRAPMPLALVLDLVEVDLLAGVIEVAVRTRGVRATLRSSPSRVVRRLLVRVLCRAVLLDVDKVAASHELAVCCSFTRCRVRPPPPA
jgi:hypothetical protein